MLCTHEVLQQAVSLRMCSATNPRAVGAGLQQCNDTPTEGDALGDRRRTAAIHRDTDPGDPGTVPSSPGFTMFRPIVQCIHVCMHVDMYTYL